jgi:FkbM family methyltransferase
MYSQNSEESYILDHFKDFTGRFLEIGAFDGRTFSNCFALAEKGWSGVCIEPSPAPFAGLMRNYDGNNNVKLVNAAISYKGAGLIEFADSRGDAISSTSAAHEARWKSYASFQHIYVNTISVGDVMHTFGEHYDFISLDVEGTNVEILQTIPLKIINPSLICIEHEERFDEILAYCKGYSEIHRNGENIILKRND